jgi:hypothetical protein
MNAACGNLDHILVDVYFSMKEHFVCKQTSVNVEFLHVFT